MKHFFMCVAFLVIFFSYCKSDEESGTTNADYMNKEDCSQTAPTYTGVIKGIMDNNCAFAGCHNAATASNGVNLEDYKSVKSSFNAKQFLCGINWGNGCFAMPKGGSKLSASTIKNITCWAKNGFPN